MPMRIEITWLMARMVVVFARYLFHALVAVTMRVEVAGRVAGVIMMFTGHLRDVLVPVPVRVKIARLVPGMIVMLTGFLVRHVVVLTVVRRDRREVGRAALPGASKPIFGPCTAPECRVYILKRLEEQGRCSP